MVTAEYLREMAARARAVAKSASPKGNQRYLEELAARFEEEAVQVDRRSAGSKPSLRGPQRPTPSRNDD
jgi:hypothetical protein